MLLQREFCVVSTLSWNAKISEFFSLRLILCSNINGYSNNTLIHIEISKLNDCDILLIYSTHLHNFLMFTWVKLILSFL